MEEIIKFIDLKYPGFGLIAVIVWKFVLVKIYRFIKIKISEYKDMRTEHLALMDTMKVIAKEFSPNGGSSIKDAISSIERNLNLLWEKQKTIMAVQGMAVFEANPEGLCTYVNRHYCDISNFSQEECLGNGWINAVHPDDRQKVFTEWNDAVKQQREFKTKYRFLSNTGEISEVIGHAFPLKDKNGKIVSYLGKITQI